MAQQDIILGTGGTDEGEFVYNAFVKAQNNFTELYALQFFRNRIIYGSSSWSGTGLTFDVIIDLYVLNGNILPTANANGTIDSINTQVTLAPADPTLPRRDVIAVDENEQIVVIQGVPNSSPQKPTINFGTQLEITDVLILAGATVPDDVSDKIIYSEFQGQPNEWDITENTGGARINLASNIDADTGSVSIETVNTNVSGDSIFLTNDVNINTENLTALVFRIKNKDLTKGAFQVSCLKDGVYLTQPVRIQANRFGYQADNISTYHTVVIPKSAFSFTSNEFNQIRLDFTTNQVFIDNIKLTFGTTNVITTPGTYLGLTDTLDTTYSGKQGFIPSVNNNLLELVDPNTLFGIPTQTSELINNGSDNTSTFVETDELGNVAFDNDYNSLDNLPEIKNPSIVTNDLRGGFYLDYLRDEANYGDVGFGAFDLSISFSPSSVLGATGQYSFAQGINVQASGYGSFSQGDSNISSESFSATFGYQNSNSSYAGFVAGYSNILTGNGYSAVFGINNTSDTNGGIMAGVDLLSTSGIGTAIFGAANVDISDTNNGTSATQPMIIVGNGTHTTPVGSPWEALSRSNLLVGLRNGEITLPSTTTTVIDSEVTGKQIVTREWVDDKIGVSTDPDNSAILGTDGKIFVPQGIPNSGSESLRYIFAAPTVPQEPTPNTLQINNVDPTLVTEIYFSTTAYPNRSVNNILELLQQGDALYLQQSNDDEHFINANITGAAVDNGTYFTVPIEIESAGIPFDINSFTNLVVYHSGGGAGGGGSQNLQQVTDVGNTTDNEIIIDVEDNGEALSVKNDLGDTIVQLGADDGKSGNIAISDKFGNDIEFGATSLIYDNQSTGGTLEIRWDVGGDNEPVIDFPDASGTIPLSFTDGTSTVTADNEGLVDISSISGGGAFVDLTTDQSVGGTKTFIDNTIIDNETSLPTPFYFEDFSTSLGDFTTSGDLPWVRVTNEGSGDSTSALSGAISNNQISKLTLTKTTTQQFTLLTFDYKTSTEEDFDWLFVVIDGQLYDRFSGIQDWTTRQLYIEGIGSHEINFIYFRDHSDSGGTNQCWIDNVGLYNYDIDLNIKGSLNIEDDIYITGNSIHKGKATFNNEIIMNSEFHLFNDTTEIRAARIRSRSSANAFTLYNQLGWQAAAMYSSDTNNVVEFFSTATDDVLKMQLGVFNDISSLEMRGTDAEVRIGQNLGTDSGNMLVVNGKSLFKDTVTADSFVKDGGLPTEYLMADGSVTTGGGSGFDPSSDQTITGNWEFDNILVVDDFRSTGNDMTFSLNGNQALRFINTGGFTPSTSTAFFQLGNGSKSGIFSGQNGGQLTNFGICTQNGLSVYSENYNAIPQPSEMLDVGGRVVANAYKSKVTTSTGVTGTYNIDYKEADTYDLTLTGPTTLTESNTPETGTTQTVVIFATGGNITLPSTGTNYTTGTYVPSANNWIVIKYFNDKRLITITQAD